MTSHVQPPRSSSPSRGAAPPTASGLELAPHVKNRPRPRTAEWDLKDLGVYKPLAVTAALPRERTRTREVAVVERDTTVSGVLSGLVMVGLLAEPAVARALSTTTSIPLVGGAALGLVSFALYFAIGQFVRRGALGVVVLAVTWVLAVATLNAVGGAGITVPAMLAAAWMWAPLAFIVGMVAQAFTHSWPRLFSWRGVFACAALSLALTMTFG